VQFPAAKVASPDENAAASSVGLTEQIVSAPGSGASSSVTRIDHGLDCDDSRLAEKRLPVLESRQAKLQAQLTAAEGARTQAQDAGKPAMVHRLEARVENVQLGLDKVGTALAKIHQTCG
jgi:hypothetical protein